MFLIHELDGPVYSIDRARLLDNLIKNMGRAHVRTIKCIYRPTHFLNSSLRWERARSLDKQTRLMIVGVILTALVRRLAQMAEQTMGNRQLLTYR